MSPSAKLVSLATAVPPYVLSQSDVAAAANRVFGGRYVDFERVARVFKSSGIRQRHAVRPIDWYLAQLGWPERTSAYIDGACRLFIDAANAALEAAELDASEVDTIVDLVDRRRDAQPRSQGRRTHWVSRRCRASPGLRTWLRRRCLRVFDCIPPGLLSSRQHCVARCGRSLHPGLPARRIDEGECSRHGTLRRWCGCLRASALTTEALPLLR